MSPELEALLHKAHRSLAASQRLFEDADYDFAASRAYYAMFYLAEALLLVLGLTFSKHSAVIAAFGQHFVKTGLLRPEHHDALRTAFDQRNVGDYAYTTPFDKETAKRLIERAKAFVKEAETCLRQSPPPGS